MFTEVTILPIYLTLEQLRLMETLLLDELAAANGRVSPVSRLDLVLLLHAAISRAVEQPRELVN
jgi:hypothetical protein